MELQTDVLDESLQRSEQLNFDQEATALLKAARKWALFLAILGFISAGLSIIGGLVMLVLFSVNDNAFGPSSPFMGFGLGLGYLIVGGLLLLPAVHLLNFSRRAHQTCKAESSIHLTETMYSLRMYFKMRGIMTIALIGIYLVFIVALIVMRLAF